MGVVSIYWPKLKDKSAELKHIKNVESQILVEHLTSANTENVLKWPNSHANHRMDEEAQVSDFSSILSV